MWDQAWLGDYADVFNFRTHPSWETLLTQGWTEILAQRGEALLQNAIAFLQGTFPWGVLALPGMWLLRREWAFFPPLVYGILLYLVTSIVFGGEDQRAFSIGASATFVTMIWTNAPLKNLLSFNSLIGVRNWTGTAFTVFWTFLIVGAAGAVAVWTRRRIVSRQRPPNPPEPPKAS